MVQHVEQRGVVEVTEGYDEKGRMIDPSNNRPYILGPSFHGLPTYIYTDTWSYKARQVLKWGWPPAVAGGIALVGHLMNWF
jgi:hypothetical protein